MGRWDSVKENEDRRKKKERNFLHETFVNDFLEDIYDRPELYRNEIYIQESEEDDDSWILPVEGNSKVICCPEPIEFVQFFDKFYEAEYSKKYDEETKKSKSLQIRREMMDALIHGQLTSKMDAFKEIDVVREERGIWFNSTKDSINLRPGIYENPEDNSYKPIVMGDVCVHGVVVGRTGSGKSVFLNNLILNMLIEYAPWELDLYLADFKKVELSRYMSAGYETPHLKTCAATSEIRYVITMLNHLVDCMLARQELFTKLGYKKISEFREAHNVVLPRIVLLIDEFQQMFEEATSTEEQEIDRLLLTITKLGRATGFHLLFASQEMSGALKSKAMANFKIRFALQCDGSISSEILGNSAASKLKIGYVIANTDSNDEEDNKLYKIPKIDGKDDTYFYKLLSKFVDKSAYYGYRKKQTFYEEDSQLEIDQLIDDVLCNKEYEKLKQEYLKTDEYYEILTLGRGVVFCEKKYDLETCFIERGHNRNIFVCCTNVNDLVYVQKLLALNIGRSPLKYKTKNWYFDFHRILSAKYDIKHEDLEAVDIVEKLEAIKREYYLRVATIKAFGQNDYKAFFYEYAKILEGYAPEISAKKLIALADYYFSILDMNDLEKACEIMMAKGAEVIAKPLRYFCSAKGYLLERNVNNIPWTKIFEPLNCWISGVEYIERIPSNWLFSVMSDAMSVNILFLVFSSSEEISFYDYIKCSEYIFLNGNNAEMYDKCGLTYTNKNRHSIVIDFKIKSLNTERSFKKYRIKTINFEAPQMDFDKLLGGK